MYEIRGLSGIYSAPPLDVVHRLASPWLVLYVAPASDQPCLTASATLTWLTTLTLLVKMSAVVTDYRGHCQSFFFPAWDYLAVHITFISIILNCQWWNVRMLMIEQIL